MTARLLFDAARGIASPHLVDAQRMTGAELEALLARLERSGERLARTPVDDLIGSCDVLASRLARPGHPLAAAYSTRGLAFLARFLSRRELERTVDASLRAPRAALDGWVSGLVAEERVRALPRGLVLHWLAGNVPVLGALSVLLALVGKNPCLAKPSADATDLLVALLAELRAIEGEEGALSSAVAVVYAERDDAATQALLSTRSAARIFWGGAEALAAFAELPRRAGSVDVVFGPRLAFAAIGRERLTKSEAQRLAALVALEASLFEQQACSSPHTLYVERGGEVSPAELARLVAAEMPKVLRRIPKAPLSLDEAGEVLRARARHLLADEVYASSGTEWTVIYADRLEAPPPACGYRLLQVRPVAELEDLERFAAPEIQTVGLAASPERARTVAAALAARGVDRVPPLGRMSWFEQPWDGVFLLATLARWVSVGESTGRQEGAE